MTGETKIEGRPVPSYVREAMADEPDHYPFMVGKRGGRDLLCLCCGFRTSCGDHAMDAVQQYAEHVAEDQRRAKTGYRQ